MIDKKYLLEILEALLNIPSPSGYTDEVTDFVILELKKLGLEAVKTNRGAVKASLNGHIGTSERVVIAHLDTLGACIKFLKNNGCLEAVPIGGLNARSAHWTRVTVLSDNNKKFRGTIIPVKASSHIYGTEGIDNQETKWENLEVRIDEKIDSIRGIETLGINVGDVIALDSGFEFTDSGFINSRFLDNKAGVAVIMAALKSLVENYKNQADIEIIFTVTEEIGNGASHVLSDNVSEVVAIDCAINAKSQNSNDYGVTICMKDSNGMYDRELSGRLIDLCNKNNIIHSRDVFKYYGSDTGAAISAGKDIKNALVCFANDASHAYERTHIDSLEAVTKLIINYILEKK